MTNELDVEFEDEVKCEKFLNMCDPPLCGFVMKKLWDFIVVFKMCSHVYIFLSSW